MKFEAIRNIDVLKLSIVATILKDIEYKDIDLKEIKKEIDNRLTLLTPNNSTRSNGVSSALKLLNDLDYIKIEDNKITNISSKLKSVSNDEVFRVNLFNDLKKELSLIGALNEDKKLNIPKMKEYLKDNTDINEGSIDRVTSSYSSLMKELINLNNNLEEKKLEKEKGIQEEKQSKVKVYQPNLF